MTPRITLQDVARVAKLHHSTVSRALLGHASLPGTTRTRVQQIATRLGYVPDPMLASLASYRQNVRRSRSQATINWVFGGPDANWWSNITTYQKFYEGARQRAQHLGFTVEPFWLRESGMSPKRASDILKARNVTGILLAPQFGACAHLRLEWSSFAVVTIGNSLISPRLHAVAPNHFRAAKTIVSKLRSYGYCRIGLALMASQDDRVDRAWSGGFLTEQLRHYPDSLIPPLLPADAPHPKIESAFFDWYERYRPDAIISCGTLFSDFFSNQGFQIPRDAGFAYLNLSEESQEEAGIFENPLSVGAAAVDLLVGVLQRNEKGIPESPQRTLIEGEWKNGSTLRYSHRAQSRT